jgi:TolA-binding protein
MEQDTKLKIIDSLIELINDYKSVYVDLSIVHKSYVEKSEKEKEYNIKEKQLEIKRLTDEIDELYEKSKYFENQLNLYKQEEKEIEHMENLEQIQAVTLENELDLCKKEIEHLMWYKNKYEELVKD